MKRLILMRHAKADMDYLGSDSCRPLTEEGKEIQERMGALMKEKQIVIDAIYHSPFTRARESAKILSSSFPKASIQEEIALGDDFDSYTVLKKLKKSKGSTSILVGHEPTLTLLASHLMKEYTFFKLDKSSMVILDFEDEVNFGQGKYKFYFSPDDLEK
jgi:phosphohistidine phosphatase